MVKDISSYEAFVVLRNFFLFGFMVYIGFSCSRFFVQKFLIFLRQFFRDLKKDR